MCVGKSPSACVSFGALFKACLGGGRGGGLITQALRCCRKLSKKYSKTPRVCWRRHVRVCFRRLFPVPEQSSDCITLPSLKKKKEEDTTIWVSIVPLFFWHLVSAFRKKKVEKKRKKVEFSMGEI